MRHADPPDPPTRPTRPYAAARRGPPGTPPSGCGLAMSLQQLCNAPRFAWRASFGVLRGVCLAASEAPFKMFQDISRNVPDHFKILVAF